jgi:hypothetical protein
VVYKVLGWTYNLQKFAMIRIFRKSATAYVIEPRYLLSKQLMQSMLSRVSAGRSESGLSCWFFIIYSDSH